MERMITPESRGWRNDQSAAVTPAGRYTSVQTTVAGLDAEAAVTGTLEATRELRSRLDSYERVLLRGLDMVRSGARMREIVQALPPDDRRMGAEVAVTELFEARRTLRRAMVAGLLSDGLSVAEIAATFREPVDGISAFAAEVGHLID